MCALVSSSRNATEADWRRGCRPGLRFTLQKLCILAKISDIERDSRSQDTQGEDHEMRSEILQSENSSNVLNVLGSVCRESILKIFLEETCCHDSDYSVETMNLYQCPSVICAPHSRASIILTLY